MIPMIDKKAFQVITQQMTPEEAQYVVDVQDLVQGAIGNDIDEGDADDVIFVGKVMAFADKFEALHWAARSVSYHNELGKFHAALCTYKDAVAENIQSIIGQFVGDTFTRIELPMGDNPLDVINELKICLNNWLQLHDGDIEYEGCRNATSGFLETVHKYIFVFRMCKISEE